MRIFFFNFFKNFSTILLIFFYISCKSRISIFITYLVFIHISSNNAVNSSMLRLELFSNFSSSNLNFIFSILLSFTSLPNTPPMFFLRFLCFFFIFCHFFLLLYLIKLTFSLSLKKLRSLKTFLASF